MKEHLLKEEHLLRESEGSKQPINLTKQWESVQWEEQLYRPSNKFTSRQILTNQATIYTELNSTSCTMSTLKIVWGKP